MSNKRIIYILIYCFQKINKNLTRYWPIRYDVIRGKISVLQVCIGHIRSYHLSLVLDEVMEHIHCIVTSSVIVLNEDKDSPLFATSSCRLMLSWSLSSWTRIDYPYWNLDSFWNQGERLRSESSTFFVAVSGQVSHRELLNLLYDN